MELHLVPAEVPTQSHTQTARPVQGSKFMSSRLSFRVYSSEGLCAILFSARQAPCRNCSGAITGAEEVAAPSGVQPFGGQTLGMRRDHKMCSIQESEGNLL